MLTPYTLPAFKFCGWCGQQDKMCFYAQDGFYFIICVNCLNPATADDLGIVSVCLLINRLNTELQPLRNDLCKQLIQLYPEDAPKYMAMILGGKQ